MTSKLLSNSMVIIWLVGCSVANEPSTYVKSDQPDAGGDTTAELQQEKVESPGEQAVKPVIAEAAPSDDKTTEPSQYFRHLWLGPNMRKKKVGTRRLGA